MQEFEKYSKLTAHIERMAQTGSVGGCDEWFDFLNELNGCLSSAHEKIDRLGLIIENGLGPEDLESDISLQTCT